MRLDIRTAEIADIDDIVGLYEEAVSWLASRGLEQWQAASGKMQNPNELVRSRFERSIERHECYVGSVNGTVAAVVIIDDYADPEFWTPEDTPESALYLHRMVVGRRWGGKELGSQILDFAACLASERGKRLIRLDAWKDNRKLHQYYVRNGFRHVRTVDLAHRGSGALFERDV